jgi:hypothetical protein
MDGDQTALPALRETLNDPAVTNQWGDLARATQWSLIERHARDNPLLREATRAKLELMRADLVGSNPTSLELLLVDRVVTCWLHLHWLELTYSVDDRMSPSLQAHYQRCITTAQKRYLAASKTLAQVRRLVVPVLQVNIASKQVNVAG